MRSRKKCFLRLLIITFFTACLIGQGIALAVDAGEFSVLAVRDYYVLPDLNSFSDADEFNACFGTLMPGGCGYTRIQYEKDSSVQYWDFYDYGTDLEADQGDILYFMGHAYSSTVSLGETIYSPLALQAFKDSRYGNSHSRSYCNPNRLGTYASSKWDDDLEWAIFAACSTLANNGSARRWGQVLYNGAHTIFGYRETSYGHPDDYYIIKGWEDRVRGIIGSSPQYLTQAWRNTHIYNSYPLIDRDNWAVVGHSANFQDKLINYGGYKPDVRGSISDVRYYDYANYSGGGVTLSSLTTTEIKGRSAKTTLQTALPSSSPEVSILKGRIANPDYQEVAKKVFKKDIRPENKKGRAGEYTVFSDATSSFFVDQTQAQVFESALTNTPISIDEYQAQQKALDFLNEIGGLPKDAEPVSIMAFQSTPLFDDNSSPLDNAEPEILSYNFEFGHSYNQIPIMGAERISVEIQDGGVVGYFRSWHEFQPAGKKAKPISAKDATDIFAKNIDKILPIAGEPIVIKDVKLVYWTEPSNVGDGSAVSRPVWRIGFQISGTESHSSLSYLNVDALTGKALY